MGNNKVEKSLRVGSPIVNGIASEILATDGSKNLQTLAVATYPSLTELTYVKGLTSAAQAQLDTKAPLDSPVFTTAVTLPVGLTGVIRADSGVVSVDSDITDIVSAASLTLAGKIEIATGVEVDTGTDNTRAVSPLGLQSITALPALDTVSTALTGVLRADSGVLAVDADITDLVSASSLTLAGKVELATTAEIDTGTDSTRAIPTDQFVASKRNIRWLVFNLVEAATDVAVATNIAGDFVSPIAGTILQSDTTPFYIYATNSTAGTTGTQVVDVHINGTSIMTTNKLDTDSTEKTTTTAATPPDLTTTALAVGDIITIDVDAVHTTPGKGLTVYIGIRE